MMAAARPHKAPPVSSSASASSTDNGQFPSILVAQRPQKKAGSDGSRSALSQVQPTHEVITALDRTVSEIEMRLAAARAAQATSQGVSSPSDSEGELGSVQPRAFFVMGVFTTFANRRKRDSIRQTWMPQGDHLRRLEKENGIVIRFVIGRSGNPDPNNEVDCAIDAEDKEYNDILRLNHIEGSEGLPVKVQIFLSTALTMWDADFYVKADDDVHVNIGITRSILVRHSLKPRVYIGCMKSGPVVTKKMYFPKDDFKHFILKNGATTKFSTAGCSL